MNSETILLYSAVGIGIFNLCLPLLRVLARRTKTKTDDEIVAALSSALEIAKEIQTRAQKKEGEK